MQIGLSSRLSKAVAGIVRVNDKSHVRLLCVCVCVCEVAGVELESGMYVCVCASECVCGGQNHYNYTLIFYQL